MFILTTVEADVRVHPRDLNKPPLTAVTDVIEHQYLDKVIQDLGLVVSIYDIQQVQGGHIYPNDGAAYFKARFRCVVFRPFVGEVVVGKLLSCNKEGLRVGLGFFGDVLIPDYALQSPSYYNDDEGVWVWKYEGSDMFMDLGEEIRFRIASLRFNPTPTAAQLQQQAAAAAAAAAADGGQPPPAGPTVHSPLEVLGDIDGDGLGLTCWWQPVAEEEPAAS
ncbi:RNA polymerase III subunit Rpc25-domain-containing protein [Scenedesmus sp. NREL 46B-D3]|nr:RNA polymerase III subunit Rpc25-domain-containing protein [Scenedesmus sp. NREL 46B-D3]